MTALLWVLYGIISVIAGIFIIGWMIKEGEDDLESGFAGLVMGAFWLPILGLALGVLFIAGPWLGLTKIAAVVYRKHKQ